MPKKHTRDLQGSRTPRPSLSWRPIFMPRDEFDEALQENLVVDPATMEHASSLASQLPGGTVVDALEILMRVGVLLIEENIPPRTDGEEETE